MLKTKSSLAKLTTYNKFILLLFFITNKFEKMKYNISRVIVRTFENPISIILHVYNIDIQNVSFHVISQLFLLWMFEANTIHQGSITKCSFLDHL